VLTTSIAAARAKTPEAEIHVDGTTDALVVGEPDRLGQIFDNLLGNALRHGRPPVTIRVQRSPELVEVEVSDAGPGVDPSVRDRLFLRFATGGSRGGTGLGLFIVRELARAYGGDAWYRADGESAGAFVVALRAASVPPSGPSTG
jgi:signal transduction histidine kinase